MINQNNFEDRLQPMEAIRAYCKQCLGMHCYNLEAVTNCTGDQATGGSCPFYPHRLGKRPSIKIFRKFCTRCTVGDHVYIANCPSRTCPVYPYRFGKNPMRNGHDHSNNFRDIAREWA